jgi:hypothetical protein
LGLLHFSIFAVVPDLSSLAQYVIITIIGVTPQKAIFTITKVKVTGCT